MSALFIYRTLLLMTTTITPELIAQSMSYTEYKTLVETLHQEGKVTGLQQSESLHNYTKMNLARIRRHEKTTVIPESTSGLVSRFSKKVFFLTISEGWCGDAAQTLPIFQKVCELSDNLEMKVILRDEHLEIMDAYLTNGARSIPKVIGLEADTLKELFVWGPRPEAAALLRTSLIEQGLGGKDIAEALHKWYASDKSQSLFGEIDTILTGALAVVTD